MRGDADRHGRLHGDGMPVGSVEASGIRQGKHRFRQRQMHEAGGRRDGRKRDLPTLRRMITPHRGRCALPRTHPYTR